MLITKAHIQVIDPHVSDKLADVYLPPINTYQGEVNTPLRMAAFLAQVLHESGGFQWPQELSSGKEYEGRKDLGNVSPGDGERYKGRGLIQITGRFNYEKVSQALFGDSRLEHEPETLATPELAVRSAYWFWNMRKLNALADAGEFEQITHRINGGLNGEDERMAYYKRAIQSFGEKL